MISRDAQALIKHSMCLWGTSTNDPTCLFHEHQQAQFVIHVTSWFLCSITASLWPQNHDNHHNDTTTVVPASSWQQPIMPHNHNTPSWVHAHRMYHPISCILKYSKVAIGSPLVNIPPSCFTVSILSSLVPSELSVHGTNCLDGIVLVPRCKLWW